MSTQQIRGFSMVELLITVALITIMSSMAIPMLSGARRRSAVFAAQREVAGQIRSARLAAITGNRTMEVRFACPAAGQYRVVEITTDTTINSLSASARCSLPWRPDADSTTLPNLDGPIMQLPEGLSFTATQNLSIDTKGLITALSGSTPATIQVTDGSSTFSVTASAAGRVQTP